MIEYNYGLEGIQIVADDILVFGKGDTDEEANVDHDKNLEKLLIRCRVLNLKLNKKNAVKIKRNHIYRPYDNKRWPSSR